MTTDDGGIRTLPDEAARALPRTVLSALLICFLVLFPLTRPEDPDVWFHLSAGRYLWTHGEYPGLDAFLYTFPAGGGSSHHEWLFQALAFPLYRALGMEALVVVKALLIAGMFGWLFFKWATRRTFVPSLLFLLLAFAAASGRFYLKPEILGAFILAGMWTLLSRPLTSRGAALFLLLQVLWTNIHWSSILGPAVVAACAVPDILGRLVRLPSRFRTGTECPSAAGYPLLLIGAVAATLVNPDGLRPFVEPFRYHFGEAFLIPIAESWPPHLTLAGRGWGSFHAWYFSTLGLGLLSFALASRKITLSHVFTFAGLAFVSLKAERNVLFFSLLSVPLVITNIGTLLEGRPPAGPRLIRAVLPLLAGVVLTTITINKITGMAFLVPYPKPYEPLSAGESPVLWPHRAADFVLEESLPGRIFNNFNSGNYLNWAIFPRRIFINGILPNPPTEKEYALIKKFPERWDDFADTWGIETVFFRLAPRIAPTSLVAALAGNAGWTLVFYDGTAAVFVRDTPANSRVTEKFSVNLEKELKEEVRKLLGDEGDSPSGSTSLPGQVDRYRRRRDQARLFRLRGRFYLLAGRSDLASVAAAVLRDLEG